MDECVVLAFTERAEEEMPFDPKDRLDTPKPDYCDECNRLTFSARVGHVRRGHAFLERVNDGT